MLFGSILGLISANFFFRKNLFDAIYFSILKEGTSKIVEPLIILILAWTLGFILKSLGTSQIIISLLPHDTTPYILPVIIFLFSCVISFATGSSFSTMGIVYPMALPIVFEVCKHAGFSPEVSNQILYHSIACVLSGDVFGDHCSPISDTTILSSIATECNHLQHVRTQLPYALIVGGVSLFMSLTLANMGIHWIFVYGLGMLVLYMVVRVFGSTYR